MPACISTLDGGRCFRFSALGTAAPTNVFNNACDVCLSAPGGQSVVYDPCDWIQASGREKQLVIPLYPARKTGVMAAASKVAGKTLKVTKTFARIAGSAVGAGGPKHMVTTSNIAYIQASVLVRGVMVQVPTCHMVPYCHCMRQGPG